MFSFCPTVYWFAESGATELSLQEIERWPTIIDRGIGSHRPIGEARSREFIRACLASTVRRRPGPGYSLHRRKIAAQRPGPTRPGALAWQLAFAR